MNLDLRQDFAADFDTLTAGFLPGYDGPPYAFVRFADGEAALLRGRSHRAKSDGWKVSGTDVPSVVDGLQLALACNLPGWHVGITAASHHPKDHALLKRQVLLPESRLTFAELFMFANYQRFQELDLADCRIVGHGARNFTRRGFEIPADAVADPTFDVQPAVDWMFKKRGPILLAAGPLANIIAYRYWRTATHLNLRRDVVVDVGSVLSPRLRGKRTRHYHDPSHEHARNVPCWS